ncbi:hypothetical protein KC367_g215 [Hortaea werneckii]|nr:hypothetical protein KC367_g215 [Hortaea werneckii]
MVSAIPIRRLASFPGRILMKVAAAFVQMVRLRLAPALTARWTISFTSIVHFERRSSISRNGDCVGRRLIGRILVFHWRTKKKDLPPLDWRGCLSEDDENMVVMSAYGMRALACYCVVATLPVYRRGRKVRSNIRRGLSIFPAVVGASATKRVRIQDRPSVRPSGWFGDLPRSEARSGDAHATLAPKRRAKLPVAAVASRGADQLTETLRIRRPTLLLPLSWNY